MSQTYVRRPIRLLLGAAILTTAALGAHAPSALAAGLSATTNGVNTASITFDGANDNPNITVDAGGFLSHDIAQGAGQPFETALDWDTATVGEQKIAAATTTLTINGGGGNDNLSAAGLTVIKAIINGDAGDDLLIGSAVADDVLGGEGDDRLVAGRSAPATFDNVQGGDGNDVLVWNNGDGTDDMNGGANADTTEVNGNPINDDVFVTKPAPGGFRFDRTNVGLFGLNLVAIERLEVNGGGGNDTTTSDAATTLPQTLNGGPGDDNLSGGDARDNINGGDDVDTLTGSLGDDRIAGDRGNDVMKGSAGDDTLVWNNGDGTDTMQGEDGFDAIEVNGNPAGDETFTLAPAVTGARFDRTSAGAFGLDISSAEALVLNALGGNDTFTVADGTPLAVFADGGSGNDTLVGSNGWESFRGGSGNDSLTGNGGLDVLDGQDGDDTILANDSAADVAVCGLGTDSVTADAAALDQVAPDCENVSRPPVVTPPVITPPVAKKFASAGISTSRSNVRNRRVAIRVTCPAAATAGCKGRLVLTASVRIGGVRVVLPVASASYSLTAGKFRTLSLRVPANLQRFAVRKRVTLTAATETRGVDGALLRRSRSVVASY